VLVYKGGERDRDNSKQIRNHKQYAKKYSCEKSRGVFEKGLRWTTLGCISKTVSLVRNLGVHADFQWIQHLCATTKVGILILIAKNQVHFILHLRCLG